MDGDQVIGHLRKTWYHLVLIDFDSIGVPEDYLARVIRKVDLDILIIGLERVGSIRTTKGYPAKHSSTGVAVASCAGG